jgi:hypothetical protein
MLPLSEQSDKKDIVDSDITEMLKSFNFNLSGSRGIPIYSTNSSVGNLPFPSPYYPYPNNNVQNNQNPMSLNEMENELKIQLAVARQRIALREAAEKYISQGLPKQNTESLEDKSDHELAEIRQRISDQDDIDCSTSRSNESIKEKKIRIKLELEDKMRLNPKELFLEFTKRTPDGSIEEQIILEKLEEYEKAGKLKSGEGKESIKSATNDELMLLLGNLSKL